MFCFKQNVVIVLHIIFRSKTKFLQTAIPQAYDQNSYIPWVFYTIITQQEELICFKVTECRYNGDFKPFHHSFEQFPVPLHIHVDCMLFLFWLVWLFSLFTPTSYLYFHFPFCTCHSNIRPTLAERRSNWGEAHLAEVWNCTWLVLFYTTILRSLYKVTMLTHPLALRWEYNAQQIRVLQNRYIVEDCFAKTYITTYW